MERPVKRALVSAAVEIVREVPIHTQTPVYDDIVPTCKKCQQERNRSKDNKHGKKGKKKQNRANTPIVIQLKDTLRAAIQQKQKSKRNLLHKQESNELKDEVDIETDNSSDRSEPNFRNSRYRKNSKNLSTFLNGVKKNHRKNYISYNYNHRKNDIDAPFNEKLVAEYVLNNVTNAQLQSKLSHKKSIVDCENVEVICNDLTSIESNQEDTEESEISSTTSSSEIQSDSDVSNPQENGYGNHEFTSYELQQLAAYTTGCPLIRYDCAPSNCPQCQWYTQCNEQKAGYKSPLSSHFKSQSGKKNKSKKFAHRNQKVPSKNTSATVELDNISNTESDVENSEVTDSPSETSADTDTSAGDSTSPVSKEKSFHWGERRSTKSHKKQLLDIDIAGKQSKSHISGSGHEPPYLDSVYINLTDTDVTFTVYYHHSFMDTQSVYPTSYANRFTSASITGTHHHDYVPCYSVPYSYQQYMYWSAFCNPIYTLPMPFCLEPKESLPKIAMVPPEDLHKCK